ncbi:MAG: hypothetical protein HC908_15470 [Calothrix sp. SM1_7_51]|nr:hypothetical protein [Calothrix sp. SM1_7_51]
MIAGKSIEADGTSKCFGMVPSHDDKPRRRIFEVLKSQGMQMNQQVTFLSDGESSIRELQYYLNPNAEYILDWFHITMRITVMTQIAKGITKKIDKPAISSESIQEKLKSVKWSLWHGNVFKALSKTEDLIYDTYTLTDDEYGQPSLEAKKLRSHIRWFPNLYRKQWTMHPKLWRSLFPSESLSQAHLLSQPSIKLLANASLKSNKCDGLQTALICALQVRAKVLNSDWAKKFRSWYPGLTLGCEQDLTLQAAI